MHNVPAIAWNAVVSIAQKVEDNILWVLTPPVIILPPITLSNPAASPLHILLKAPYALIIKQLRLLAGKLKDTMLWPELAKARVQQQHQPYLPISVAQW